MIRGVKSVEGDGENGFFYNFFSFSETLAT